MRAAWLVPFLFSLFPLGVGAQPTAGPDRDSARTFLVIRIADALQLNDQDALKVSAVIRRSDERQLVLAKQREDLESTLRAALAKTANDPAELSTLIRNGNDLDNQLALLPEKTFHELQQILSIEQQAKLWLFRRELQGEVRRAMQRRTGSNQGGKTRRSTKSTPKD